MVKPRFLDLLTGVLVSVEGRVFGTVALWLVVVALPGCVAAQGDVPPHQRSVYYFADCQAGAAVDCAPGDNAHDGRNPSRPRRTLQGLALNNLPAGARLLFMRGGAWELPSILEFHNLNATPANPLVVDAYGSGNAPLLRTSAPIGLQFGGRWGNTTNDGGYVVRNITLQGTNIDADTRGVWLVQNVRDVTLDNVTITGFRLGMESANGTPYGVTGLTVRNSRISGNRSMGILGSYSNAVIEGNTFEGNNFSGSSFNHAIYLSGGQGNVIRGNRFINNSIVDGQCRGGNVTVHGKIDGLLIQDNAISLPAATSSCYGFAVTVGYDTPEAFHNVVIRDNTVVNAGFTAIAANAAPGIVIEGNRVIQTQTGQQQYSIWVPANRGARSQDAADRDAVVRNNIVCLAEQRNSVAISVNVPGAVVDGNQVFVGREARSPACAVLR